MKQPDWLPKPGTLFEAKRWLYYSLPENFHCGTIDVGQIIMLVSLNENSCASKSITKAFKTKFYEFLWQDKKIEIDLPIFATNENHEGFFYECFKKAEPK